MRLWFANLITCSRALTLSGVYVPFTDIGGASLRMLAATRDITVSRADAAEFTDRFATMAPHPEVPAALRRLRDSGFRLFSVDETVKRHKPGSAPLDVGPQPDYIGTDLSVIADKLIEKYGAGN